MRTEHPFRPPTSGPPDERHDTDQARSTDVLRRAAHDVRARVGPLAERVVERIREVEPFYRDPSNPPGDVTEVVHDALAAGLLSLTDPAHENESGDYLAWLGGHRAEQGVPLDSLLRGYRAGGDLFWASLVAAAQEHGQDGVRLLVRSATEIWGLFARDTGLMADAYRRAADRVGRGTEHRATALRVLLAHPLTGAPDPGMTAAEAAAALALPPHGRFAAVAVTARAARAGGLLDAPLHLRVLRAPHARGETLVVELGDLSAEELAASLDVPPGTRAGVGPAVDPAGLGHSARLADLALRTCTGDREVAVLDTRIPAGLLVRSPDLAAELADDVLGAVLAAGHVESALLLEALAAWLDADGSAEHAADRLYCHRNTVLKRLRRIEELTGRSIGRPRDLVELSLALDTYRVSALSGSR